MQVLFSLRPKEKGKEKTHLVVVNVSPITYGHALLVPEPSTCLPQVHTHISLHTIMDFTS